MVSPDNGILVLFSALKRNELPSHRQTWRKCKCILLSERSQLEKATYCMIKYMAFWKRQNYGGSKKIWGCQELAVGKGMNRQSRGDQRAVKLLGVILS